MRPTDAPINSAYSEPEIRAVSGLKIATKAHIIAMIGAPTAKKIKSAPLCVNMTNAKPPKALAIVSKT